MSDHLFFAEHEGECEDAPYAWLDEWLCEYVDGTMDPAVEATFEEYVQANPDLKEHIEQLRHTRNLLCECRLPQQPSDAKKAQLCSRVECEMLRTQQSLGETLKEHPTTLGVASSVAVALVVGLFMSTMWLEPNHLIDDPTSDSPSAPQATARSSSSAAATPVFTPWLTWHEPAPATDAPRPTYTLPAGPMSPNPAMHLASDSLSLNVFLSAR